MSIREKHNRALLALRVHATNLPGVTVRDYCAWLSLVGRAA